MDRLAVAHFYTAKYKARACWRTYALPVQFGAATSKAAGEKYWFGHSQSLSRNLSNGGKQFV
jgi:hypothetical protein